MFLADNMCVCVGYFQHCADVNVNELEKDINWQNTVWQWIVTGVVQDER